MDYKNAWNKLCKLLITSVCCSLFVHMAIAAEKPQVLIWGKDASLNASFAKYLAGRQFDTRYVQVAELAALRPRGGELLLIVAPAACPPESRLAISRYVQAGGKIALAGAGGFNYAPRPEKAVNVVDMNRQGSYRWVKPVRTRPNASVDQEKMTGTVDPWGNAAVEVATPRRGMRDVMLHANIAPFAGSRRSVLCFNARGNAYMDLLAVEVVDREQRKWYGFVPLDTVWKQVALSFADLVPEGYNNKETPYPLLDPAAVRAISIGTNMMTVWREKPMRFSLSAISLAENATGFYTPTSALSRLAIPFLENDMKAPAWTYNPFADAIPLKGIKAFIPANAVHHGEPVSVNLGNAWECPAPYRPHPGTKTGTDTKGDYQVFLRNPVRCIPLLVAGNGKAAGELRLHEASGASEVLFGVEPQALINNAHLAGLLADAMHYSLMPKILSANVNTAINAPYQPVLSVLVQNPSAERVKIRLNASIGNNVLQGQKADEVAASSVQKITITLNDVPANFNPVYFTSRITLQAGAHIDVLQDTIDVKSAMLATFSHLATLQEQYPDGRYTHHYFGDAYGVRAIMAYINTRLEATGDLTPQETRIYESGRRFCQMLEQRQNADGSLPMGYSEHSGGYNVADGGQIVLSLAQVAAFRSIPDWKKNMLPVCDRFLHWAETFYISDTVFHRLAEHLPKGDSTRILPGLYGLGMSGRRRVESGPSWVLSDIIACQYLMAQLRESSQYRQIAQRNSRFYLSKNYPAAGYYQAEALCWAWLAETDPALRKKIAARLEEEFLPVLLKGAEGDMYTLGGRNTLKALPLLYYQRQLGRDSAPLRAVLLKYIWAFASTQGALSVEHFADAFPKAIHGESLAAAKYLELSSLWAMELLHPGSTVTGMGIHNN